MPAVLMLVLVVADMDLKERPEFKKIAPVYNSYLKSLARVSFSYEWKSPTEGYGLRGRIDRDGWSEYISVRHEVLPKNNEFMFNKEHLFDGKRWRTHFIDPVTGQARLAHLERNYPRIFGEAHPFAAFGLYVSDRRRISLAEVMQQGELHSVINHDTKKMVVFQLSYEGGRYNLAFEIDPPYKLLGWELQLSRSLQVRYVDRFAQSDGIWHPQVATFGFQKSDATNSHLVKSGEFVIDDQRGTMLIKDFKLTRSVDVPQLLAREKQIDVIDQITGETIYAPRSTAEAITKAQKAVDDTVERLAEVRARASDRVTRATSTSRWAIVRLTIALGACVAIIVGIALRMRQHN